MRETDANLELMSEVLGVSQTTARVMANRGIRTKNTAHAFLSASLESLHPFGGMKDSLRALRHIHDAIHAGQKITIFGDYDADGICSTVILYKTLLQLGANACYYIPHRIKEGYGLNNKAIDIIAQGGTTLIIALDNGISAVQEVDYAKSLGITTIIVDHHEPGSTLPHAAAIIDPKQEDCTYPFKECCAAGLTFKLAHALHDYMGKPFTLRDELLLLACIGTVCDVVQLRDENRAIVSLGLVVVNANKFINPGIGTLLTARNYLDKPLDAFSMGYVLGPCINAAGRLASANIAVDLLLASDMPTRINLAHKLIDLNEERKQLTADCTQRILSKISDDKVIVIVDEATHESIAGIVAGRIREATMRPTIVFTRGEDGMKGSGRSPRCYNIFEALNANKHLFTRFGGHAMAAGISMQAENIEELRHALNRDCKLTGDDFVSTVDIDGILPMHEITLPLADELTRLAPFGTGNHEPLFATYGVKVESIRIIDQKKTLIFAFSQPGLRSSVKGIAFGLNEKFCTAIAESDKENIIMDIVYAIEQNVYNGHTSVQLRIKDFVIAGNKGAGENGDK